MQGIGRKEAADVYKRQERSLPLYLLQQGRNLLHTLWFQVVIGVVLLLIIALIILRIIAGHRRRKRQRVRGYRRY